MAIEEILGKSEIRSMNILRNYETHYQSIFLSIIKATALMVVGYIKGLFHQWIYL